MANRNLNISDCNKLQSRISCAGGPVLLVEGISHLWWLSSGARCSIRLSGAVALLM